LSGTSRLVPAETVDLSVIAPVWARITDLVIDRGQGCWLYTKDGDRYLDLTSGIGVVNTGHAHPTVVRAIQEQAAKLVHGQQNILYHEPGLELHTRLAGLLPGSGWGAFLANSGAEAVEAAVKLARVATGRSALLAFRYGFHGRTAQTMSLTSSRVAVRGPFEPLPGSVYLTGFPYCYRAASGSHSPDDCVCDWREQLDLTFAQLVAPEDVAAVIVEPVLGEGGYVVPPADFLPELRQLTRRYGILLVADEIQTGFGRTGRMLAVEHWDVVPDIVVLAKGIASGLPLSGLIAQRSLIGAWVPGSHGGTFGGNVVACAAANATLDVIASEGLLENATNRGRQLIQGLARVVATRPEIGDLRGVGLMVGIEFVKPGVRDGREPDAERAKRVQAEALARHMLVLTAGTHGNVIRLVPPLVITEDEVELAVSTFADCLEAAS
jgi:4-aminobutyrate aminotransferase